jgi:DUF2924 family protein
MTPRPDLAEELRALPRLSRDELAEKWGALYGAPPPPRTSRSLMLRAVAYKLQENAYGGLSPVVRRMLLSLGNPSPTKSRTRTLRAGTILLREWQGVTHRVTMIEGGAVYRGERYRSLSEVARLITGARWSGPRFFGLKPDGQA